MSASSSSSSLSAGGSTAALPVAADMSVSDQMLPLAFHRAIVTELLADDSALVVLARGLGCSSLIRFFAHSFATKTALVFVLDAGRSSSPDHTLFASLPADTDLNHVHVFTAETGSAQRQQAYLRGGVFLVTARILIVDLLQNKIPIHLITGFLVRNAEKVNETSTEAFILRLFRADNQVGFIRAFTESPEALVGGFSKLEKLMASLQLRKLFAWPRFHVTVAESLSAHPVDTIEIHLQASPNMHLSQLAILELVTACLAEMRPHFPNLSYESLDGGLGDSPFDEPSGVDLDERSRRRRKRRTIEHASKTLAEAFINHGSHAIGIGARPPSGTKARHLWHDLHLLRSLLDALAEMDAISFLSFLETIYASCAPGSGSVFAQRESSWILTEPAGRLLKLSRERVYTNDMTQGQPSDDPVLRQIEEEAGIRAMLEVPPKWAVLKEVLEEIAKDPLYRIRNGSDDEDDITEAPVPLGRRPRVLILCNERKTSRQVATYLVHGDATLSSHFQGYLSWSRSLRATTTAGLAQAAPPTTLPTRPNAPVLPGSIAAKRRRVRTNAAQTSSSSSLSTNRSDSLSLAIQSAETVLATALENTAHSQATGDGDDGAVPATDVDMSSSDPLTTAQFHDLDVFIRVPSHTADDETLLTNMYPDVIVMYDPNPTMVRRIEVYQAVQRQDIHLRTYMLAYKDSTEEQRYLAAIRREREAFERVIKTAASMVVPLMGSASTVASSARTHDEQDLEAGIVLAGAESLGGPRTVRNASQATAAVPKVRQVVVDVREFRAALPGALHMRGIKVVPCTLEVGDYVLAPDVVVERKSYSDLVQSLAGGRLYTQVSAMTRNYASVAIIIEIFDRDTLSLFQTSGSAFDNAPAFNPTTAIQSGQDQVAAKLVLLTIHFPKLRILWSSSPTMSAELLDGLKRGREEPSSETAMAVGTEDGVGLAHVNLVPQGILRAIPGVERDAERRVMESYATVARMVNIASTAHGKAELKKALGGEERAQKLVTFVTTRSGDLSNR